MVFLVELDNGSPHDLNTHHNHLCAVTFAVTGELDGFLFSFFFPRILKKNRVIPQYDENYDTILPFVARQGNNSFGTFPLNFFFFIKGQSKNKVSDFADVHQKIPSPIL